jgi:phage/plasmid primase-like uncharacterized protein
VIVERELMRRLPPLPSIEKQVFRQDHIVNQRGFPVDRALAVAIAAMVKNYQPVINAKIAELTNGSVSTPGQGKRILNYLASKGCSLDNLQKPTVKKALKREITGAAKELLELRAAGNQSAAKKATALLRSLDDDDRLRDTLVYHGAGPGRWTAKGFQPQNLKRAPEDIDADAAIAAVMSGNIANVEALGPPLSVIAGLSRAMLCASPGHVFIGGDFSSIEGCVTAWYAGEQWKLANYHEFFATGDPEREPYCMTATRMLKRKVTPADKAGRALGKVADLALGFGGGVKAWRNGAANAGMDDTRPDQEVQKDVYSWRNEHPKTVQFWEELERALRKAIKRPNQRIACGRVSAEFSDGTLRIFLPSGRAISYPSAKLVPGKFPDTLNIAFMDNKGGSWKEVSAWRGVFVENVVQATARDLLAEAMMRLEENSFPVVLTVHDEVVCEIPEGSDRLNQFFDLMTTPPAWAVGLPISAKHWTGKRFLKSSRKPSLATELPPPNPQPALQCGPTPEPLNGTSIVEEEAPVKPHHNGYASYDAQIRQQMMEAGIDEPPDLIIPDGQFHRFGHKNSGWYVVHSDPILTYWYFGDFAKDIKGHGESHVGYSLTQEERTAIEQRQNELQAKTQAERKLFWAAAAVETNDRWERSELAPEDHGYLRKKKISPCGVRADGQLLLVPMCDINGKLWSLQEISPTGWKSYQAGGRVKGCFCQIGEFGETFLIAEGFSTSVTLHTATGLAVAAAGHAGNLEIVARQLRDKNPDARIILCGDDDWLKPGNPGKRAAEKAAAGVNGEVRLPQFNAARPPGATDFNDMASLYGFAAVRQCVLGGGDGGGDKGGEGGRANGNGAGEAPRNGGRPTIQIKPGFIHDTATEGESALIGAGAPLYVRGNIIMIPVVEDETASHGRTTKVARLKDGGSDTMVDYLSRSARFEKWDGRAKKFVATNPPHDVAQTILSRDGEWQFPRIHGVITTPTLRPNGTILDMPGYDRATRLLLLEPPEMPAIPENPTRADAEAALELLKGLIAEFPFIDDASQSVALSALITPVVRGAMTVAPFHVFTAPTPGTGKSYLADIANAMPPGSAAQSCPPVKTKPRPKNALQVSPLQVRLLSASTTIMARSVVICSPS